MIRPTFERDGVRLYLGDSLAILPHIDYAGVGAVLMDPPYGIDVGSHDAGSQLVDGCTGDADTYARDFVLRHLEGLPTLCFGSPRAPRPQNVRHVLTWDKGGHTGMGDLSFPWRADTEEIYVIGEGWPSRARRSSVLRYMAVTGLVEMHTERSHPFAKPVALLQELVRACPAGAILDPFMGSGTTGIAAWREGRGFIGVEIEPEHFEAAKRRIVGEMEGEPLLSQRSSGGVG